MSKYSASGSRNYRRALYAALILPVLHHTDVASAQILFGGPQFQVNSYTTRSQSEGAVGMAPDGDFVVVWTSDGSGGADDNPFSIQARRFSSDGAALDDQFQVNSYTSGVQSSPAVAMGQSGEFVTVWSDFYDELQPLKMRRFDSSGTSLGGELRVDADAGYDPILPDVSMDSSGEFVVAWVSRVEPFAGEQIKSRVGAHRFAADGSPIGTEFEVTQDPAFVGSVSVSMAASGDFVATWDAAPNNPNSTDTDVFARRFASTGTPLGSVFQVNTATETIPASADVAVASSGEFIVVWTTIEFAEGGPIGPGRVRGRGYDADGTPVGDPFQINSTGLESRPQASVALDGSGGFVVAWDDGSLTEDRDLRARQFAASGTASGTEFQLNTYTTGIQLSPCLSSNGAGGFVAVWASYGSGGTDEDGLSIQAQLLTTGSRRACGDAIADGAATVRVGAQSEITALDALAVLEAAIGVRSCELCVCDVDDSGMITPVDALGVLRHVVGLDVQLICPSCV